MLNALWAFMMLTGLGWAAVHGTLGAVTEGMLAAAGDAVSLGITMLGVMAFWTGILEIGRRAGLIEQVVGGDAAGASFPLSTHSSGSSGAFFDGRQYDCQYAGAWLGGDPGGAYGDEGAGRTGGGTESGGDPAAVTQGTASDEMCTFLVVNISSLQLIPINMIAYRSQYGSTHPLAVAGPAFLATCISTLAGVAVCHVMCRRKQYKSIKKDGWK